MPRRLTVGPAQDPGVHHVQVRMAPDLHDAVRIAAASRRQSVQAWMLAAIRGAAIDRVVARLERETGLRRCGGPRNEGTALDHGRPTARHYAVTLGSPCRGGGYTPRGEVWISIPVA